MKIAAQMYTVRESTKTPEGIYNTFKKLKAMGYDYVQFSGAGPIDPVQLKEYLDETGIGICVTHLPFDKIVGETEEVIKNHKLWNCNYIGLGAMAEKYRVDAQGYKNFIADMELAVDKIYDSGLKFVYHNHHFEFEKFDGITGMEILNQNTSPEKFGFLVDLYWVQAGGANPAKFVTDYSERIEIVHYKDMQVISGEQAMAEVGEGNMDWDLINTACKNAGVKWCAIEQDECQRDPFESLSISLANVKNMGL